MSVQSLLTLHVEHSVNVCVKFPSQRAVSWANHLHPFWWNGYLGLQNREEDAGLIGLTLVVAGVGGSIIAGIWLDRTKLFKYELSFSQWTYEVLDSLSVGVQYLHVWVWMLVPKSELLREKCDQSHFEPTGHAGDFSFKTEVMTGYGRCLAHMPVNDTSSALSPSHPAQVSPV